MINSGCAGSSATAKRRQRLCIAIPASFTEDIPHLREKTYRIGLVGRACSIFRVDQIMIFYDNPEKDQANDADLTAAVLRYMNMPQYLRRTLIRIDSKLQFVGILPPLRAPHHPLTRDRKDLRIGMLRQGVVTGGQGNSSLVDIGLSEPAVVQGSLPRKSIVTVRITRTTGGVEAAKAEDSEIRIYWGYDVTLTKNPLAESTRRIGFDLVISTSRYGNSISEVLPKLQSTWAKSNKILVAFGSPTRGLKEILEHEGLDLNDYADFIVNTIPDQGVETVRTEEAIYTSLSILNILG